MVGRAETTIPLDLVNHAARHRFLRADFLQLADDVVLASIRDDRRTVLPEHTVSVASHGNAVAGTQQGHGIFVSSHYSLVAIAGKGQGLTIPGDDNWVEARSRGHISWQWFCGDVGSCIHRR